MCSCSPCTVHHHWDISYVFPVIGKQEVDRFMCGNATCSSAYLDNTIGHDIPFIVSHCPPLFPTQVLLIIPHTQGFEAPPKLPIQRVSLLRICRVGVTGTPKESWWPLDYTGGTKTLHTEVWPRVLGRLGGTGSRREHRGVSLRVSYSVPNS